MRKSMASRALEGKVIVITGASAGIGEAIARECASRGASVVLAARRIERLERIAKELESSGAKALAIKIDVSKEEDCECMVAAAVERFGRLDVLVANAGYGLMARAAETNDGDARRLFDVNVFGLLSCCRAAVPVMRKQGGGHLILISSVAGSIVSPLSGAYCATKAAVNALGKAMRQELRQDGIDVSIICPGPVRTEFHSLIAERTGMAVEAGPKSAVQGAEDIARIVTRCVSRPERLVITSPAMRLARLAYAHFPWLVERMLSGRLRASSPSRSSR